MHSQSGSSSWQRWTVVAGPLSVAGGGQACVCIDVSVPIRLGQRKYSKLVALDGLIVQGKLVWSMAHGADDWQMA